ncbi:Asp-tRNA(Asn)/Glu-tRNA(Gln) amidotransferase subunit GatB [Nanoarchaeota archaeon]
MTNKFTTDVVIGLEIHVELDTKSKMFCGCSTDLAEAEPNSLVCETCLGHPGSKPVLNKKVVDFALKLCMALNCKIASSIHFSRKSYFYPDMAKNFQITQFEVPLGEKGVLKLKDGKEIKITRLHIEEDPAALVHPESITTSKYVMVDYNRSGHALAEIVTEPDMTSPEEARDFLKELIRVLTYLKVFDVNNGIIKADANISIKESGYIRAEIKNITGFKEIERALNYELERQKEAVSKGEKFVQSTRTWDSNEGVTHHLRTKETEADYGYIIDPDLVEIEVGKDWLDKIKSEMPELAQEKSKKFIDSYGIDKEFANILAKELELAEMFEKVAKEVDPKLTAFWLRRELLRVMNFNKISFGDLKIDASHMIALLKLVEAKKITDKVGQSIIEKLVVSPFDVDKYVKENDLGAVSDLGAIEKMCKEAVDENPKAVEEFKGGEEKALNFLVGQVMRKSKGKAVPNEVNIILKKLIK